MQKERLLKLADLLRQNAANPKGAKFDLDTWGSNDTENFTVDCGTTVCAVGLACVSGAFAAEGLSYKVGGSAPEFYIVPLFRGLDNFAACEELFQITRRQAEYLFSPDFYVRQPARGAEGEQYVADRITEFVQSDGRSCNKYEDPYEIDVEDDWTDGI